MPALQKNVMDLIKEHEFFNVLKEFQKLEAQVDNPAAGTYLNQSMIFLNQTLSSILKDLKSNIKQTDRKSGLTQERMTKIIELVGKLKDA